MAGEAPIVSRDATLSPCGLYRYTLTRTWGDPDGPLAAWVMLNPSTANAREDDPTIRRCVGFSQRWGYDRLVVVNLFALRSTDPKALRNAADPVGPENDHHIVEQTDGARAVFAAWGVHGAHAGRDRAVMALLVRHDVFCLGTTRDGHPRHPLYVAGLQPAVDFKGVTRG